MNTYGLLCIASLLKALLYFNETNMTSIMANQCTHEQEYIKEVHTKTC